MFGFTKSYEHIQHEVQHIPKATRLMIPLNKCMGGPSEATPSTPVLASIDVFGKPKCSWETDEPWCGAARDDNNPNVTSNSLPITHPGAWITRSFRHTDEVYWIIDSSGHCDRFWHHSYFRRQVLGIADWTKVLGLVQEQGRVACMDSRRDE